MFFLFLNVFWGFLKVFFVVIKTKTYKITNMMHFSWTKTPISWTERVFYSSIIDFI